MSQKRPADAALSGSVPKSSRTDPTTSTAAAETDWVTAGPYMHRRVLHTVTYGDGSVSRWARVTAWLPDHVANGPLWRVEFEKQPHGYNAVQELEWFEIQKAMYDASQQSAPGRTQKASRPEDASAQHFHQEVPTDEWHTDGHPLIGKQILLPFPYEDGSQTRTWAVVTAWLPAHESNYQDSQGKHAALWRITFDVDGFNGCPKDLLQDLEEHELSEAIKNAENYYNGIRGGPPPPSAPASSASTAGPPARRIIQRKPILVPTTGSGGCASSASAAGASSASAAGASSASAAGASSASAAGASSASAAGRLWRLRFCCLCGVSCIPRG
jgi:hypothetical protein